MDILTVKNFSVYYQNKRIVNSITFDLKKGELVALLGLNGSGKTTIIKGICSLLKTSGECFVNSKPFTHLSNKEKSKLVSYIPQKLDINFSITVIDLVLMGFNAHMGIFDEYTLLQKEEARHALEKVNMIHKAHADILTLSEGEKQLVVLARAIVQNTNLFLLDEPDSAMDFNNKHMILSRIRTLVKQDGAGIISIHDANFAMEYCDRALLIKDGEIIDSVDFRKSSAQLIEEKLSVIYGDIIIMEMEQKKVMMKKYVEVS